MPDTSSTTHAIAVAIDFNHNNRAYYTIDVTRCGEWNEVYYPAEYACQHSFTRENWQYDGWASLNWMADVGIGNYFNTHWWAAEFPAAVTIKGFGLKQADDNANVAAEEFKLWSSTNGTSWTERAHVDGLMADSYRDFLPSPISAKYWKFTGINQQGASDTDGWRVYTFLLYGDIVESDFTHAYLQGYQADPENVDDSIHAYSQGTYIWKEDQKAYLKGAVLSSQTRAAFLFGGALIRSDTPAFIGSTGGIKRSSIHAFVGTPVARSSIHSFIGDAAELGDIPGGVIMVEQAFIWLKTSDAGVTKSKKFRVAAAGYDDGTPEKAETLERTIGGGLNLNMGAIYKTWSPLIMVRHTEPEVDYGTLDDLIYFFNLNAPNSTPSNKITFVDHHDQSYTVYMIGNMKKNTLGFKTEGETAWFIVAIRMIQVQ